jgi:thiol-disulfide isomerase/thioredoxin
MLAVTALALAACTGDAAVVPSPAASPAASPSTAVASPSAAPAETPSAAASADPSGDPSPVPPPSPAVSLDQPWATAALTDVATGQPFRIADHAGKVIFIETMAIWCVNCRSQQADALEALEKLGDADVQYVVLDVEPSEAEADLAKYEKKHGWDAFTYAVATPEVSRALADDFGDLVLNPPATPIVVVGADGRVTLTDFGHKSTDELVALARDHGA